MWLTSCVVCLCLCLCFVCSDVGAKQMCQDKAKQTPMQRCQCLQLCPNTTAQDFSAVHGWCWCCCSVPSSDQATVLLQQWCTDCLSALFINIWPWFMQLLKFILLPAMFVRVCLCLCASSFSSSMRTSGQTESCTEQQLNFSRSRTLCPCLFLPFPSSTTVALVNWHRWLVSVCMCVCPSVYN